MDNSEFFLDNLFDLLTLAKDNFAKKGDPVLAVDSLDNATRLALLIAGSKPLPTANGGDPYGSCPDILTDGLDNPKGLFVGRLMALKHATCSEIEEGKPPSNAKVPKCAIATDIEAALPPLP